jgi:hypothetical protein
MLYVSGRVLYWTWKQIDEYVLYVWDLILPENPVVRFGAGVTLMMFLFIIVPMVVLQQLNFFEEDDVEIEGNETDGETQPTSTPTPAEDETSERIVTEEPPLVMGAERVG